MGEREQGEGGVGGSKGRVRDRLCEGGWELEWKKGGRVEEGNE